MWTDDPGLAARALAGRAALRESVAQASALAHAAGGQDHVTLQLAPLPALTQYLIDRGSLTEEHVGYQMFMRLVTGALGLDNLYPSSWYENLHEYEETLRYHGGDAILNLLHGQGLASDAAAVGAMGRTQKHAVAAASPRPQWRL